MNKEISTSVTNLRKKSPSPRKNVSPSSPKKLKYRKFSKRERPLIYQKSSASI